MTAKRPEGTVARQQHLLASAITVVGSTGLRGLTHRAVDRAAELPEGTCSVYYRTRLALLSALTEYVGERLSHDVQNLAEELPQDGNPEPAIEPTFELLMRWADEPALLITMVELGLEAVRTPSLQGPAHAWREHLTELVECVVRRGEKTQPRVRSQAIVASMEGLAISALTMTPQARKTYLHNTIGLLMAGVAQAELPS